MTDTPKRRYVSYGEGFREIEDAPRDTPAEALDVERLRQAINKTDVFSYDTNHDAYSLAEAIAAEYARLSEGNEHD